MKALILAIILLAQPVSAIEEDKKRHLITSAAIYQVSYGITNNRTKSFLIAFGLGLAKELSDNKFDNQDIKFNLIGIVIPWSFQ